MYSPVLLVKHRLLGYLLTFLIGEALPKLMFK